MLSVNLKPSWQLGILFFYLHVGAVICACFLQIIWLLKIVLILLCLFSLFFVLSRYVLLLSSHSIVKIAQIKKDQWSLFNRDGDEIQSRLHGSSVKTPYFMLLNFVAVNSKHSYKVVVLSNSQTANDFRRLQIALFH